MYPEITSQQIITGIFKWKFAIFRIFLIFKHIILQFSIYRLFRILKLLNTIRFIQDFIKGGSWFVCHLFCSVDLFQHENERTPEGSEVNYETTPAPVPAPACASPPAKKKKISSDRKKQKLEPKSLSFEHREGILFKDWKTKNFWEFINVLS